MKKFKSYGNELMEHIDKSIKEKNEEGIENLISFFHQFVPKEMASDFSDGDKTIRNFSRILREIFSLLSAMHATDPSDKQEKILKKIVLNTEELRKISIYGAIDAYNLCVCYINWRLNKEPQWFEKNKTVLENSFKMMGVKVQGGPIYVVDLVPQSTSSEIEIKKRREELVKRLEEWFGIKVDKKYDYKELNALGDIFENITYKINLNNENSRQAFRIRLGDLFKETNRPLDLFLNFFDTYDPQGKQYYVYINSLILALSERSQIDGIFYLSYITKWRRLYEIYRYNVMDVLLNKGDIAAYIAEMRCNFLAQQSSPVLLADGKGRETLFSKVLIGMLKFAMIDNLREIGYIVKNSQYQNLEPSKQEQDIYWSLLAGKKEKCSIESIKIFILKDKKESIKCLLKDKDIERVYDKTDKLLRTVLPESYCSGKYDIIGFVSLMICVSQAEQFSLVISHFGLTRGTSKPIMLHTILKHPDRYRIKEMQLYLTYLMQKTSIIYFFGVQKAEEIFWKRRVVDRFIMRSIRSLNSWERVNEFMQCWKNVCDYLDDTMNG